jgi:hypothetical protein
MSGAKLDATHPPKGWRLVVPGEVLPAEKMFWGCGCGPWERNKARTGEIFQCSVMFAPCAVRAEAVVPSSKPLKWEPVDLLSKLPKKPTHADYYAVVVEASATINKQGREIVRLKNQARKAKA